MGIVLTTEADQFGATHRGGPHENSGKKRIMFFDIAALTVTHDAGSQIKLPALPPGKVRVIPAESRIKVGAGNAGLLLDIGHRAYLKADDTVEAEDLNALTVDPLDIAAASEGLVLGQGVSFSMHSKGGIGLVLNNTVAALPIGWTASGYITYVTD